MRYQNIADITFRNANGKSLILKDMREYPKVQTTMVNLSNVKEFDKIDEIATRTEIYGAEAESESYKIFDANIVNLFDNRFNMAKIKNLSIPL